MRRSELGDQSMEVAYLTYSPEQLPPELMRNILISNILENARIDRAYEAISVPPQPQPGRYYEQQPPMSAYSYEEPRKLPEYYKPPHMPPLDPELIKSIIPPYQPAPPPYPPQNRAQPYYSRPYPAPVSMPSPLPYSPAEYPPMYSSGQYPPYAPEIPAQYYPQPQPTPFMDPAKTRQPEFPSYAPPPPSYLPESIQPPSQGYMEPAVSKPSTTVVPQVEIKAEVKHESIEDKYEQVWSGFLTRSKQHRVGVDAYSVSGNVSELLADYNLNVSHRTTLEEAVKAGPAVVGVAAFTSQNETQNSMFKNYIDYFSTKERV